MVDNYKADLASEQHGHATTCGSSSATGCSVSKWKDGIHKEGMETYFYTRTRRFALRMTEDMLGTRPVWVVESHRQNTGITD